ncbi:carbohydrate ABC transporter permease [Paenibacillus sp. MZ04-78.2]|uniref:carbohydrate ABC transporter permease n=1 Tax=Paenibacillus sp. MZ04-78.2 TaxID=2962034 RepID=UPI0020B7BB39|nr:carbohydrate ABC transporter permease [Paenibacillus sp. MZ04-78.2]MCP3775766.1 carbohydrate ABC transporter permease [Paenibacillus sp. MZ04-78.2]
MRLNSIRLPQILLQIALLIAGVVFLVPFYLLIVNSLKPPAEAAVLGLGLPTKLEWANYAKVFKMGNLLLAFKNSMFITSASVIIIVITAAATAFFLQRRKDALSKYTNHLVMLGLVVPPAIVPLYKILNFFHLNGTLTGVILVNVAIRSPLSVYLCYQFLKSISKEIDEAAIIDGSGKYRLFFRIIFPLLGPILVTIVIFNAIYVWNDFVYVLFFLSSGTKITLPLTLYLFTGQYSTQWNYVFADIIIISLPLLAIYFAAQRFIIAGLTAGATKG